MGLIISTTIGFFVTIKRADILRALKTVCGTEYEFNIGHYSGTKAIYIQKILVFENCCQCTWEIVRELLNPERL